MILCCGESLIDMIPVEKKGGGLAYSPHTGGAVFNTSIALGRLGVTTELFTGLSSDLFGDQLRQQLTDNHVSYQHAELTDRPTTLAFVTLENGSASYFFYDENSAGRMISSKFSSGDLLGVDALFFGGISLAVEPCADTYAELLQEASSDKFIMLDPNIRIGFIQNERRYRNRLDRIISCSDAIKVSDDDLDWLKPGSASLEEKVSSLLRDGPDVVFLTKGAKGASAYLKNGLTVDVAGEAVKVVDTVGAGDTFNAAILSGLERSDFLRKGAILSASADDVNNILAYAAKAAAISVTRAGANPPWAKEIM